MTYIINNFKIFYIIIIILLILISVIFKYFNKIENFTTTIQSIYTTGPVTSANTLYGLSCQACNYICPSGQYKSECGGYSPGICKACEDCPAGEYRSECGVIEPTFGYFITNGLIAHYKFDRDFSDSSGNGNNLSIGNGNPTFSTEKVYGQSANFLSDDAYLETSLIDLSNRAFSISVWIKTTSIINDAYIVSQGHTTNDNELLHIGMRHNTGNIKYILSFMDNDLETLSIYESDLNEWVHLVFVVDSNYNRKIFRNGVLIASDKNTSAFSSTSSFKVGTRYINNGIGYHSFTGYMDDLRVYNRALTTTEVLKLYNNSFITKTTIDSEYKYIMFKNDGNNQSEYSITFPENITCDILVIGGGGGGGGAQQNSRGAGGGGAGEYLYQSGLIFNGTYNILVGKGGNGGTGTETNTSAVDENNGDNGFTSSITQSTTVYDAFGGGGGAGGVKGGTTTANGGACGGGKVTQGDGGIGSIGYNGGNGSDTNSWVGGGGGGMGSVGGNGSSSGGGAGGDGVAMDINIDIGNVCGGGGGGGYTEIGIRGGNGIDGGGDGGGYSGITNGTAYNGIDADNYGGGGGGATIGNSSSGNKSGGKGGPGVVIIRYRIPGPGNCKSCPLTITNYGDVTNSLIAHYKFDGDFNDSSGNDKHLTLYNNTSTSALDSIISIDGESLLVDGDTYLEHSVSNYFTGENMTYSIWIHGGTQGSNQTIFSARDGTNKGIILFLRNDGRLAIFTGDSGWGWAGTYIPTTSIPDLFDNTWKHIVILKNNSNQISVYYNNTILINNYNPGSGGTIQTHLSSSLRIGGWGTSDNTEYLNNGTRLDEFRIYNRVLSSTEITDLYKSGFIIKTTIDDEYKYIMFKNNGNNQSEYSITSPENTTCDILVVGGGGAGGSAGGSGGGGDVIEYKNLNLSGTYDIFVGRGGLHSNNDDECEAGENGFNSKIMKDGNDYIIAAGGGGGGNYGWSCDEKRGTPARETPTATFENPITYERVTTSGGGGGVTWWNRDPGSGNGVSGRGGMTENIHGTFAWGDRGGAGGGAVGRATASYDGGPNHPRWSNPGWQMDQYFGKGGEGYKSDITGELIGYGGGGSAGQWNPPTDWTAEYKKNLSPSIDGGGSFNEPGIDGRGGGGSNGSNGGSGVVIIRYRIPGPDC